MKGFDNQHSVGGISNEEVMSYQGPEIVSTFVNEFQCACSALVVQRIKKDCHFQLPT